eukprot:2363515-Pyramimonas_sp.AAC.1
MEPMSQQFCHGRASCCVVRRRLRVAHAGRCASEGVTKLNDLYGRFGSRPDVGPNAGQRLALEHLRQ